MDILWQWLPAVNDLLSKDGLPLYWPESIACWALNSPPNPSSHMDGMSPALYCCGEGVLKDTARLSLLLPDYLPQHEEYKHFCFLDYSLHA